MAKKKAVPDPVRWDMDYEEPGEHEYRRVIKRFEGGTSKSLAIPRHMAEEGYDWALTYEEIVSDGAIVVLERRKVEPWIAVKSQEVGKKKRSDRLF